MFGVCLLKVGCFIACLSSLGPAMFCGLFAVPAVIACIAALVVSATDTALAIASSLAIIIVCFFLPK